MIQCEVRLNDVAPEGRKNRYFNLRTTDTKDYVCSIILSESGMKIQKDDNDHAGPDVAVLTLLALQASFLIPPFGYAVMMARTNMVQAVRAGALTRCLLPFLGIQILVLGLTVLFPAITHLLP